MTGIPPQHTAYRYRRMLSSGKEYQRPKTATKLSTPILKISEAHTFIQLRRKEWLKRGAQCLSGRSIESSEAAVLIWRHG